MDYDEGGALFPEPLNRGQLQLDCIEQRINATDPGELRNRLDVPNPVSASTIAVTP